jgi:hypothetical protein
MKKQQRLSKGRLACLKGRSAHVVAVGTLAIVGVGQVPVAWAAVHTQDQTLAATVAFDIPAGTLVDALGRWKQLTGVSLEMTLSPETVAGFRSGAVRGMLTNAEALKQILDGTGLGFHFERVYGEPDGHGADGGGGAAVHFAGAGDDDAAGWAAECAGNFAGGG